MGNRYFREAIAASLDEYMQKQSRFEKSFVVQNIVDEIHGRGGRFLKQDSRTGRYTIELSMTQSRDKVGHAIRDAANLYVSKLRPPQPQDHNIVAYNVPPAAVAPVAASVGAESRKPSAKRPRPPPRQQQQQRGSLGSSAASSSSILSLAGDDITSPIISGRDSRSTNNPNLLYQSPIQYPSNLPQRPEGYFYYDPSSPSASSTSLYRFDPLVNPNIKNNDIRPSVGTAGNPNVVFPTQQQLPRQQSIPTYPIDPQVYRQQVRQQLYQQQLRQQESLGVDPLYSNYPSQQLATYNVPIPQQQQQLQQPLTIPPAAETIQPPMLEPLTGQATVPMQQQDLMRGPFMSTSYPMPHHSTADHPLNVSVSNFDAYTQMLFQEQHDRFYHNFHGSQNRPSNYTEQNHPRQQNNDDNDVFLDAIDSVLGPMDSDNDNNQFDNDLQPQPQNLTVDDGSATLGPQRMIEQSLMQPHDQSRGPFDSPTDSSEDQKVAPSLPPTSHRPAR